MRTGCRQPPHREALGRRSFEAWVFKYFCLSVTHVISWSRHPLYVSCVPNGSHANLMFFGSFVSFFLSRLWGPLPQRVCLDAV